MGTFVWYTDLAGHTSTRNQKHWRGNRLVENKNQWGD
jgi:hypothetical protein